MPDERRPSDPSKSFSARWSFALAAGATIAAISAVVLQLAVVPTALACAGATALIQLDAQAATLARRLVMRFETDVTEDASRIERRPWVTLALFCLFPLAMAFNAWISAEPDDQWNPLAAAITAGGCWVGWAFAQQLRLSHRASRWFPAWLTVALAVGIFYTVGGPFRVRWAVCESRLTAAVQRGEPIERDTVGRMCWYDATERDVDGERRLYFDGGQLNANGTGLVYSPDRSIEQAGGIRVLRELGGGWYWFETGSVLRSIWFDG